MELVLGLLIEAPADHFSVEQQLLLELPVAVLAVPWWLTRLG